MQYTFDFIVIGSGIAGLNTALTLANHGTVLIITKQKLADCATQLAQGGIAAVINKKDSINSHVKDTLITGSYHNEKNAVDFLVSRGQEAIKLLQKLGVSFNKQTSFEAAHSYPRIFHATDFTGQEIEKVLIKNIVNHPNIEIREYAFAIDLIVKNKKCFGIQILKNKTCINVFSRATVLATGGVGQLYQWTTNPIIATGDGIAMAYRAGARLSDLEFVQFHPTALKEKESPLFLLSEALRGEGAVLIDSKGNKFMKDFHTQAELAPRDIVTRAIFQKQKEGKEIYLDIRHKEKDFILKRFPNIHKTLLKKGFDLTTDAIPVTPAAHFLCGGVITDLYGRTSIQNLFAYGEVANTGVHGANRLASNSLLEGMVFPSQIKYCIDELPKLPPCHPELSNEGSHCLEIEHAPINPGIRKKIQQLMWNYVGIERSPQGLAFVMKQLQNFKKEISQSYEIKNMITVALLIVKAAYKRKKSLGTHYVI